MVPILYFRELFDLMSISYMLIVICIDPCKNLKSTYCVLGSDKHFMCILLFNPTYLIENIVVLNYR